MVLPVKSFARVGANLGPVKFQVGINQFPGKTYWVEGLVRWDGSAWRDKFSQKERAFYTTLLSIRASTMKPILSPSLSAGLEVGCEIPLSTWKKKWKNAAGDITIAPPEVTEYTLVDMELLGSLDAPEQDYTQSLEIKERLLVVPVLGKLAYTSYGGTRLGIALSLGAYIINARISGITTHTYVQSVPPYVPGERDTMEMTFSSTSCSPGGEFSLQLSLPLSDIFSVGFNGWVGYIGKATIFWGAEWTGYTQIEWSPAAPEMSSLKQLFEAGGLSYGGGLSLNLFF